MAPCQDIGSMSWKVVWVKDLEIGFEAEPSVVGCFSTDPLFGCLAFMLHVVVLISCPSSVCVVVYSTLDGPLVCRVLIEGSISRMLRMEDGS